MTTQTLRDVPQPMIDGKGGNGHVVSDAVRLVGGRVEQLLWRELAGGQTLPMVVTQEGLQHLAVGLTLLDDLGRGVGQE